MSLHAGPKMQTEAPEERISSLCAAILRISASLDVGTVVKEAVEGARMLTGARYGLITVLPEAGEDLDAVFSGLTQDEAYRLRTWSDALDVFKHFRELQGAIRLNDLSAYVRSLGFSSEHVLSETFQCAPMRHRGEHVGNFFLAEKEGGKKFTDGDEEILMLFASQVATAITNARTHRREQRARADLEALVETSPVGVIVFDARTGHPLSFNREALRIVESLRVPGRTLEQLLEAVVCRRADGRDVALSELPLSQQFLTGEKVRAEEVVLSVADRGCVRTLVNSTPISGTDGEIETAVVTLQDLAPIEELERTRAEFLGMVSHELRTPLAAIKGSATTVLDSADGVDPELVQFFRIIDEQANQMDGLVSDLLDIGRIDTGTVSVTPEPLEVAALVDRARNTFQSGGGQHTVHIELPLHLPQVMADRRRIVQVLNNLLINAARHSPESLPIRVSAEREGVHVAVSVTDEGRGVPPELLPKLFQKYFSSGDATAGHSQSGLGLSICRGLVEAHGGRIRAESGGVGQGTRFTFTLPVCADESTRIVDETLAGEAKQTRILVVDDDPHTLRFLRNTLDRAGYGTLVTGEHTELSRLIRHENPQLVLLDLMLPGSNGLELMDSVPELAELPVIFISGYGQGETIAKALELGAADYIVKPFSPPELCARIEAALRKQAGSEPFVLGELTIRYEDRTVTIAGQAVWLTATEFELLRTLSVNAGRVVTYETLLRVVWGGRENVDAPVVRTFVRKLRRKLGEEAANPAWIFNVRGVGYRMPSPGDPDGF